MSTLSPPFGGPWAFPSTLCEGEHEYALIDESRLRIVQFFLAKPGSLKRQPMRLWYRPQSATSILTSLKRDYPWREFGYALEGDTIAWTPGEIILTWHRLPWAERPDWLDAQLADAYSRMDAAEQSGDAPVA